MTEKHNLKKKKKKSSLFQVLQLLISNLLPTFLPIVIDVAISQAYVLKHLLKLLYFITLLFTFYISFKYTILLKFCDFEKFKETCISQVIQSYTKLTVVSQFISVVGKITNICSWECKASLPTVCYHQSLVLCLLCNDIGLFLLYSLQSAAAAPSPVLGNIPPGDGMPVGPVPPGFFQVHRETLTRNVKAQELLFGFT